MARKLEEILKAKGFTEEEMVALKPMLENAKFRASLEDEFANADYFAEVGRKDSAEALRWREEEALPQINKALDSERKARAELAAKNEQLRVLQEQGLIKLEEQQIQKAEEQKPTYVTEEQLKGYYGTFAEAEGAAMVMVQDLAAEYQDLYGKSLFNYTNQEGKRGLQALREEAKAQRSTNLYEFVSKKFDFTKKREEIKVQREAEHEKQIRADERAKVVAETINPLLRTPRPSIAPLITAKDKDGKMPWDNPEERKQARLERVTQKALVGAI